MENKVDHGPVNEERLNVEEIVVQTTKQMPALCVRMASTRNRIVEDGLREQCVHEQE